MTPLSPIKRRSRTVGARSPSHKRRKVSVSPSTHNESPECSEKCQMSGFRHRSLSIDSLPETSRHRSRSIDSITEPDFLSQDGIITSHPSSPRSSVRLRMDAVVISQGRPSVPRYQPFRNEVAETEVLEVLGETKGSGQGIPVRKLSNFTIYGHDGKYLPFVFVIWCLERGVRRTILTSGVVTRCLEESDDEDDVKSVDAGIPVSLQPLVDFWVDYGRDKSNAVWIGTQDSWYILQEPNPLYTSLYRPFWATHRLTCWIAKAAREDPQIKLTAVLQRLKIKQETEAMLIMGRELAVSDFDEPYPILYSLEQLSSPSLNDSQKLVKTALLQDLASRAATLNMSMDDLFDIGGTELKNSGHDRMPTVTMPLVHELTTGVFLKTLLKAGKELDHEERRHKLLKSPEPPIILHPDSPTNIEWDEPVEGLPNYFRRVYLDGEPYNVGDVVMVNPGKDDLIHRAKSAAEECSQSGNSLLNKVWFCRIMYMHKEQTAHVQWYQDGAKTILQETAHPYGLFALAECEDIPIGAILGRCTVQHLKPGDREPNDYHCSFLWDAGNCRFLDHAVITNRKGPAHNSHPYCDCCDFNRKSRDTAQESFIHSYSHATVRGIQYHKHDFVYIAVTPNRPYMTGQIRRFIIDKDFQLEKTKVELTRIGRYDDVSCATEDKKKSSYGRKDERRLFMTEQVESYPLHLLEGKFFVYDVDSLAVHEEAEAFYMDRWAREVAVHNVAALRPFPARSLTVCKMCLDEAKEQQRRVREYMENQRPLRVMELFAGAGGLSTGLEQSGFVKTFWAVEFSPGAAATFQANHPGANVYNQDVNVCLQSAIDAWEGKPQSPMCSLADGNELPPMPQRGEVDVITGGFPCQSFSGMNHQRHKRPDDIRTTLVANMLSYVEFYRPRYVLMENVRGLLQYHIRGDTSSGDDVDGERLIKMGIVKFILRALTCLGYQAQLKLLQAADYGSPQRRDRVIFWGARRSHILPDYPLPTHVTPYHKSHTLRLPTHELLTPSQRSERGCAPFPALVVADAISDLPGFEWKHPREGIWQTEERRMNRWPQLSGVSNIMGPLTGFLEPVAYATLPNTRYQKMLRGNQTKVTLHCSRTFGEMIVERVWHTCRDDVVGPEDLPRHVWTRGMENASQSELAKIWRVRFGRLQWKKPFYTALTACQPFSKGGRILHPKQKRIITARECARSQGFPDYYEFVQREEDAKPEAWTRLLNDIHKQIGNAVPVPLAHALGNSLGKALVAKWWAEFDRTD